MNRVDWARAALVDLLRIRAYLAQFNPHAAARVAAALREAANGLSDIPERGRPVPNAMQRELVAVYPYILRYRVRSGRVTILRIRHAAQQPAP